MEQLTIARSQLMVGVDNSLAGLISDYVSVPVGDDTRWLKGTLHTIQKELARVENFLKSGRAYAFENGQEDLIRLKTSEIHFQMALAGYPGLVNLELLSMLKKGTGLPAFMVVNLDTHRFEIQATYQPGNSSVVFFPTIPREMTDEYAVTVKKLLEESRKSHLTEFVAADYAGSVPAKTRYLIEQAINSGYFTDIWVMPEAEMKRGAIARVRHDPLVIGTLPFMVRSDGSEAILAFFIDCFDPTPLEKSIAEEYVFSPHK